MTFEVFIHLPELEQLNTLIIAGQPIGESADNQYRLFLYKVSSFFVTVTYCSRTDKLLSIRAFQQYKRMLLTPPAITTYFKRDVQ